MCFYLHHGWLDSRRFVDRQQSLQSDVRQSDGPALAMIHETFHRSPGVEQSNVVVVKDIAVFISRVLLVSGLKRKWSVNEIEVQIIEPESIQARFESRFDALRPVICVPQLCGNKNGFARDPSGGKSCLQRPAYLSLVT